MNQIILKDDAEFARPPDQAIPLIEKECTTRSALNDPYITTIQFACNEQNKIDEL